MDCTKNLFALKLSKKYKMSDEDFTDLMWEIQEGGYSKGYKDGYKRCAEYTKHKLKELLAQLNDLN